MVEATVALIVVFAVVATAPATTGAPTAPTIAKTPAQLPIRCMRLRVILYSFFFFYCPNACIFAEQYGYVNDFGVFLTTSLWWRCK
jgi:hypothetical protein